MQQLYLVASLLGWLCLSQIQAHPTLTDFPETSPPPCDSTLGIRIIDTTVAFCNGAQLGFVMAVARGGSGGYNFTVTGLPSGIPYPVTITGDTVVSVGLPQGLYTVQVTDPVSGCTEITWTYLYPPPFTQVDFNYTQTNCQGDSTLVQAMPTDGVAPYQYQWSTGDTTAQLILAIDSFYTVTVTDAYQCTVVRQVTPHSFVAYATVIQPSCQSPHFGQARLRAVGGTPPYSYQWSNGQTADVDTILAPGSYQATVTDAQGCTYFLNFFIQSYQSLQVNLTKQDVSCVGRNDGSASATASGGQSPYQYCWTPSNQYSRTLTNLDTGWFYIHVIDREGCEVKDSMYIDMPRYELIAQDPTCANTPNGQVNIIANPVGRSYYSQITSLTTGQNPYFNQLLGDDCYAVYVRQNSSGCEWRDTVCLVDPPEILLSATITDPTCPQPPNGQLQLSASNGAAPYRYIWANGALGPNGTNLAPGNYTVTVADANNCWEDSTFVLDGTNVLTTSVGHQDPSCFGGADGTATVTPTGGVAPYTYAWMPMGATTATITGLSAGSYSVSVTDNNGCLVSNGVTLADPPLLLAPITDHQDGSATAQPTGGTPPYQYLWSLQAQTTARATGLASNTTYTVTVIDANGCTQQGTVRTGVNTRTGGNQQTRGGLGGISITPNPAQNLVRVHWDIGRETEVHLRVVNAFGQVLLEQPRLSSTGRDSRLLDIQHLAAGWYVIEVTTATRQWAQRLMVQ